MFTLYKLASIVGGKAIGAHDVEISGVSDIRSGAPNTVTFLFRPTQKDLIQTSSAAAIVVSDRNLLSGKNGIVVDNPRLAMAKILALFNPVVSLQKGIHPTAIVDDFAIIDNTVSVGAFCIIGAGVKIGNSSVIHPHVTIGDNTDIGNNTEIHPQVAIYDRCQIGNNVLIHSGTVIGSDGYGFETVDDIHHKIPQIGAVIIEDNVEIGANCTIDRGTIGNTIIGTGTKIDNIVHIAHNVKIGKGCLFMALVGIAGGVEIGDYCIFAGRCGVSDNLKIGDRAIFAAKSGVSKSLPGSKIYAGMPAREIREKNKRDAAYKQIELLKKRIQHLEHKAD